MCGIGGILRTDGQPIPEEWLDAIDARIAYRGPDGCGRFRDRVEIDDASFSGGKRIIEVAFVHRRLSIIDHAGGHQPMVSERGRNDREGLVAVVFNGCIYNHRKLRKELKGKGHTFVTDHSDTEVLIHGWREWGENINGHLEGMYAFAVWDRAKCNLFVARDLFGEKPLYVRHGYMTTLPPSVIIRAFASEPSSLVQLPLEGSPPEELPSPSQVVFGEEPSSTQGSCDPSQWSQWYLQTGYLVPGTAVMNAEGADTADVPSGCSLAYSHEQTPRVQTRRQQRTLDSETTCNIAEIEGLLDRAVERRLEADVPVGCFLSGGVDSSLVACFSKRHMPDVRTFSVRMPDVRYDESRFAERVARYLPTVHMTLAVATEPVADLIKLIDVVGQPFGDSSILPAYWVSKAARDHVKVALSGDGGDELFLGYERYLLARTLARHWRLLRRIPASVFHGAHPKSRLNKLARLTDMAKDFRVAGVASMESIFTIDDIAALTDDPVHDPVWADRGDDALLTLREFDLQNYLPGDLLRKVDTASMACGLEVRCPFLDRDLARAALSAPIEQLMPRGQRKGLLRQIARKYLPKEIVDRPKMGFAIPIGEWFRDDNLPHRGAGMKTLLLDHLNSAEPFGPISLNRKAVQRFIDEHMAGGFRGRDHGQRLFTLLTLSIWARQLKEPVRYLKCENAYGSKG